mmetsp:Transcript_40189/g.116054  ORF Transcript_40189/g.116054 Transcript_40189/m.116054 type:complete len:247 (-) Transcript_40189:368-1108(-)
MHEVLAQCQLAPRVERGHDSASAGAAGRPIDHASPSRRPAPVELAVRHDHRVPGVYGAAFPPPALGEDEDVAAGVVELGVVHRVLLAAGDLDHLAHAAELLAVLRQDLQAHAGGIHDRVEHASVGDVEPHLADAAGHVDLHVHVGRPAEGRHVSQRDSSGLAGRALRGDAHKSCRGLQLELRHWLHHGHHARLQQGSGRTDHVVAAHGRVDAVLLADDHTKSRFRMCTAGRQDVVHVLAWVAARLL